MPLNGECEIKEGSRIDRLFYVPLKFAKLIEMGFETLPVGMWGVDPDSKDVVNKYFVIKEIPRVSWINNCIFMESIGYNGV